MAADSFNALLRPGGLTAEYFSSDDLNPENVAVVRTDSTVNFDWGTGSPHPGLVPNEDFSVRWSGTLRPEHTEKYTFTVSGQSDAGVRLHVNDKVLIEAWTIASDFRYVTNVDLVAGEAVEVELEYRDLGGNASVRVDWESPRSAKTTWAAANLSPARIQPIPNGILREQWSAISGATLVDLERSTVFDDNVPESAVLESKFSVDSTATVAISEEYLGNRFRSVLIAPETGYYTFRVTSDDAARLRVSNDASIENAAVVVEIDAGLESKKSDPIYMIGGEAYYLEALHLGDGSNDRFSVTWTTPSNDIAASIPIEHLYVESPQVQLRAVDSLVNESGGENAKFLVTRSDDLGRPLQVAYTVGGSAVLGTDFVASAEFVDRGTVTIPAGQAAVEIEFPILLDALDESTEEIVVRLVPSPTLAYQLGRETTQRATATIVDDADSMFQQSYISDHRSSTASWRLESEQRIRDLRTSRQTIEVRDMDDNLIEGAVVSVDLVKHAFPFDASFSQALADQRDQQGNLTDDANRYRSIHDQWFTPLDRTDLVPVDASFSFNDPVSIDLFNDRVYQSLLGGASLEADAFSVLGPAADPQSVADLTNDLLTALFAHPAVAGITVASLHSEDGLTDDQWKLTGFGQSWTDLVFDQWRTVRRGTTTSDGTYGFSGFDGDYRVTVDYRGRSETFHATLGDQESPFVAEIGGLVGDLRLMGDLQSLVVQDLSNGNYMIEQPVVADGKTQVSTGPLGEQIDVDPLPLSLHARLSTYGGDDTIRLSEIGPIEIDGGTGYDRIVLSSASGDYDLATIAGNLLVGIEELELTNFSGTITIDPASVTALRGTGAQVTVIQGDESQVITTGDWAAGEMLWSSGRWYHQLMHNDARLLIANRNAWQNPLNPMDVDRNGEVTARDALLVVNDIPTRTGIQLPRPLSDRELVDHYFDTNGDSKSSALDALAIINWLAQTSLESQRAEAQHSTDKVFAVTKDWTPDREDAKDEVYLPPSTLF